MQSGISENIWVNLLGFQLAWWLAVLTDSFALPFLLALVSLHLLLHRSPVTEGLIVISVALLGYCLDALLMHAGVFIFSDYALFPPLWLLALWLCFAATLRQGLAWFQSRLLLSVVCGAVCGSLSYLGGAKLGAVELGQPVGLSFLVLFLVWGALFPLFFKVVEIMEAVRGSSNVS